jgi:hypothetical protein
MYDRQCLLYVVYRNDIFPNTAKFLACMFPPLNQAVPPNQADASISCSEVKHAAADT